ncbi:helix-turn-helix domain-containing protein [Oleiharenicola lentus]|uniref:helix-turn-helix domain-containing protein n=1 Tax=Oleiharenicola lentus TaxID=2508720 RepID=UPI003F67EF19
MGKNKFLELETLKKQVASLEKQLIKRQRKLLALPGKFGFKTVGDFVNAIQSAGKAAGGAFQKAQASSGKRTRAKITPEIKAQVKSLVHDGKTGAEIASKLGISVPSVANIKKELGLVKKR